MVVSSILNIKIVILDIILLISTWVNLWLLNLMFIIIREYASLYVYFSTVLALIHAFQHFFLRLELSKEDHVLSTLNKIRSKVKDLLLDSRAANMVKLQNISAGNSTRKMKNVKNINRAAADVSSKGLWIILAAYTDMHLI